MSPRKQIRPLRSRSHFHIHRTCPLTVEYLAKILRFERPDAIVPGIGGQIRAMFYRTDDPDSADGKRLTSETLWISFPDYDTLPEIVLTGAGIQ